MSVDGSLALRRRGRRAGQTLGYLLVSVPLALASVVALVVFGLGAALSLLGGIGLPVLRAGGTACRSLVRLDRRCANRLLGTRLPPLAPPPRPAGGSPWRRSMALLADRSLLRMATLVALKVPVTVGLAITALTLPALFVWLVHLGVQGVAGLGDVAYFGPWTFGPVMGVALLAFALPVAVVALAALDGLRSPLRLLMRALLLPRATPNAPVRELLAESLGDHSVAIAYWLPDREMFVDEAGQRIELPDPASGRAWTAVEQDGVPVAAIVHDAGLDTTSELVQAAAAAAALAIDNERLKADLHARVEELRDSRLRIVEATDAARRRIERDLHDGAQQQLVALALELRILRGRAGDRADLLPLVDALSERLASALAELRELARGIHPTILTDRGLAPAIASLADRTPVRVEASVEVDRLPAPVEAAAYFVVAEALTNVAKYSGASRVAVAVSREAGEVLVDVVDDGIGGVDVGAGSGLRGLRDRLAAVDGDLDIESPEGQGTHLRARIPVRVEAEDVA